MVCMPSHGRRAPPCPCPRVRRGAQARTRAQARPQRRRGRCCAASRSGAACTPGDTVVVAGATGGVGQLTVAKLAERGFMVRALSRDKPRCQALFAGDKASDNIECVEADGRDASSLAGVFEGASAVVCCTGTTAFPSARWKADDNGSNNPKATDLVGATNLIKAAATQAPALRRYALLTSAGVERYDSFGPYAMMNAFGVLECKAESERYLREQSGLPYTIVRPCRLTDGPYTSYDLNTLLGGVAGNRQEVVLKQGDSLDGEVSRIAVAECLVQCLTHAETSGAVFGMESTEGAGPGKDADAWSALFAGVVSA